MPREQINTPSLGLVIDERGNELDYEPSVGIPKGADAYYDPALHVHWRRPEGSEWVIGNERGGVQVSLELPADVLRNRAERLDDRVITTSIFTPDLTRREINRLIRVLKIARDKAYGRDE